MSVTQKPQRAFLTATLMTMLAVAAIFMVYAALLASYTGGDVTIQSMGGSVQYSLTQTGSYSYGSINQAPSAEWYARVYLATPPTQTVIFTWTLQKQNGSDWTTNNPITVYTFNSPTISLTPSNSTMYAYSSGSNDINNNYNWGIQTATTGVYRIKADINTV